MIPVRIHPTSEGALGGRHTEVPLERQVQIWEGGPVAVWLERSMAVKYDFKYLACRSTGHPVREGEIREPWYK